MGLLESISCPADLQRLDSAELPSLAAEIRQFLVDKICRTGGHLGPNLGVVELTIALHRVFDSPRDRILFDTGHQSYVHKMLTGRLPDFDRIRQRGGISGYPSQTESVHDVIENSHASTSLSYANGLAKGYRVRGIHDRAVVAVIGDGALTGGMAWEALNNIAADRDIPLVIVVNDNGRSYGPTVGGLASHLAGLRNATDIVAGSPQGMFEELGFKQVGPVDGHDVEAVETALHQAVAFGGPVIVHCLTRKGKGYEHAENDIADQFHAIPVIDPATGKKPASGAQTWTSVFGRELVRLGEADSRVVATTAAMLHPTGLGEFASRFPQRVFDVGIAEQHAVTSAAGLALAGLRPVVAVYATFLNRAFDQVLMDVSLHHCPVVFVLDRAGVTGDDGASHNGVWDISLLQVVPGLRIAAPRDADTMRRALDEAMRVDDAPSVIRFPKGAIGEDIPAVGELNGMDVLRFGISNDVLIACAGPMTGLGLDVAVRLEEQYGVSATVVDPRWLKPLNPGLTEMALDHQLVVTIEDGVRAGGFGAALATELADVGLNIPVLSFGVPERFLDHGKRTEVLAECGLTAAEIAGAVAERSAQIIPWLVPAETELRGTAR